MREEIRFISDARIIKFSQRFNDIRSRDISGFPCWVPNKHREEQKSKRIAYSLLIL